MRLPLAYSTDLERTIDVEEAYELFWEGYIVAKQNFECADENCNIQITAANLDKLRENMKRDPFYVTKNLHSTFCGFNPQNIKVTCAKLKTKKRSVAKSAVIHFCTTRPKSHYQVKNSANARTKEDHGKPVIKDKNLKKKYELETRPETPRRYSITPLVSHYSKICDTKQSNIEVIETDRFSISFDHMFVHVNGQSTESLSPFWRIYYGQSDILKLKNGQFLIKFRNTFEYQGHQIKPSLFIDNRLLEKAFNKKLKEKKLTHYASKHEPGWVFVYSSPTYNLSKDNNHYLNFNIKTMDFFDLRDSFSIN